MLYECLPREETPDENSPKDPDTLKVISTLDDTGIKVKGMEVFDDLDNPDSSTVICLKTQDDTFLMYVLS